MKRPIQNSQFLFYGSIFAVFAFMLAVNLVFTENKSNISSLPPTDIRHLIDCSYRIPFTIHKTLHSYLNFNVLKAISANMIDIIQNLTTIFPSFHPFNSKW